MRRLRTRVFTLIMVPTLVVFLLVGGGGLLLVDRSYREQVMRDRTNQVASASRGIDNWLIARISTMVLLSETPLVETGDAHRIVSFLRSQQERLSFIFSRIYYILPDGSYWDTAGGEGRGVSNAFLREFTEKGRLFYYSAPVLNDPLFESCMLIGVPVTVNGKPRAILASTIDLSTFRRTVADFARAGFSSFAVVNPRGEIITDSTGLASGSSEAARYGRVFTVAGSYRGDMVFVSVLRTTWKLLLFEPAARVLAPIREMNTLMVLFLVVVALLAAAVSLLVSGAVARPVRLLTEGVHQLMEGNYRQQVAVETKDELSELADAFNRLADRMVKLRADDQFLFLGHIAARMAHEIRKPLHIVQLAAQSLRTGGASREKYLRLIDQEIANADRFIREILNFVRPEQLSLTRYRLQDLVEKTVRKYQLVADEHCIALSYEAGDALPPFYFDILRMDEVVSNLLQNAMEAAARDGERRVTVRVAAEPDRGAVLTIIDSGAGFDEATIERVLDPYFTTKENGTGLGLSLCYRILTAHGAKLVLDNTPEHHGRVEVIFPL